MESRNPSHLAELIPHHNHSSLDGLNPVDILKPTNGRWVAPMQATGIRTHDGSSVLTP